MLPLTTGEGFGWRYALVLVKYGAHRRSFLFFQGEDGIRDSSVTGVQTCALPILVEIPDYRRCSRGLFVVDAERIGLLADVALTMRNNVEFVQRPFANARNESFPDT